MPLVLAGPKAVTCDDIPQAFQILGGIDRANEYMDSQVPPEERGADWTPRRSGRFFDVALYRPSELGAPAADAAKQPDAAEFRERVVATRSRIIALYQRSMSKIAAETIVAPYTPEDIKRDEQSIAQLVHEDDSRIMCAIADREVGVLSLLREIVDFAAEHKHPHLASWHLAKLAAPVELEVVAERGYSGMTQLRVWPVGEPGIIREAGRQVPPWLEMQVVTWSEDKPADFDKKNKGRSRTERLMDKYRLWPKTSTYRAPRFGPVRGGIPRFNVDDVQYITGGISDEPSFGVTLDGLPFYKENCIPQGEGEDEVELSPFGFPYMASRKGVLSRRLGEVQWDSLGRAFPELYGVRLDPTKLEPAKIYAVADTLPQFKQPEQPELMYSAHDMAKDTEDEEESTSPPSAPAPPKQSS